MSRPIYVSNAQVDRAAYVVDTSSAVALLEQALDSAPQGRPAQLSLRTWLIGGLLAVDAAASFKATSIHQALTGMSRDKQWELGVLYEDRRGGVCTVNKSNCDYLAKRLSRGLASTKTAKERFGLTVTDEELQRRGRLRQAALDALLDASKVDTHHGWFAADGSSTWSWGRAHRTLTDPHDVRADEEVHDDPDAADDPDRTPDEVVDEASASEDEAPKVEAEVPPAAGSDSRGHVRKSHDYDASIGTKTRRMGGREAYFGYVLDAIVRVSPPGKPAVPMVIERLRLSPASADVVAPTLDILDSMRNAGVTVTDLCVDRHYSYKKVERWAVPLAERGINQHFDLRKKEQEGFRDVDGARMVGGWLHCPATPDEMTDIPRPGPGSTPDQRAAFDRQIEQRWTWALDRDTRPGTSGSARFTCPAVAAKVGCPLRDGSIVKARYHGLPIVSDPPAWETAPKCCTNKSGKATYKEPQLRKHDQPHYWGSQRWKAAYDRRVFIEGVFGSIKSNDTEGLSRGFTRYVGLPLMSIGLHLIAVVANIRHQRKYWAEQDKSPDHPLLEPEPEDHGWKALTAEESALLDAHKRGLGPAA